MQNASAGGSPLDFLARFAGPIAWLIAGLLLLFGGLPFGGEEDFFEKGGFSEANNSLEPCFFLTVKTWDNSAILGKLHQNTVKTLCPIEFD